jgi:hypothetical protein
MPRKEFAAFTRLDASDVNTYLMDQAVQTFAGTASRGSAITTPVEGMVTYLEDLNRYDTYNGSSHVPMGGLTLVKTQTIGSAVSSVTVNNAFSADYDDYKIIVSGGVGSAALTLRIQLGSSTEGYAYVRRAINFETGVETLNRASATTIWDFAGSANTPFMQLNVELLGPFINKWTTISGFNTPLGTTGPYGGNHKVDSSFSDFTISTSTGTITGGTIYVYGFKKA